jgi:CDP-diacylglycerol--serine O-phosphatidyltransferase
MNAAFLIWGALIFDFLDGFSARLLKVQSPVGKELDSLADVVTFGVLPAFILFGLLRESTLPAYFSYAAFLVAVFSALRLAKFNVDDRQQVDFIGLPTPANALFISSLVFLYDTSLHWLAGPYALLGIAIVFSYLLVSPIRMFSLKIVPGGLSGNSLKIIFLILSILLLIFFRQAGIPLIIIVYILLSLLTQRQAEGNESGPETLS